MKLGLLLLLGSSVLAHAELRLPSIFTDHMVLQRNQSNPVWGWDKPGSEVVVSFGSQEKKAVADEKGKWTVKLDPLPANATPAILRCKGTSSVEVSDVLVGEVWLCSGQSNMEWILKNCWDGDLESLATKNANLRLITVPNVGTQEMQDDFKGSWSVSAPESALNFSAVGYYYGSLLQKVLDVPVGLIANPWGGSAAEAWVRRSTLEADPRFKEIIDHWKKLETSYNPEEAKKKHEADLAAWKVKSDEARQQGRDVPPAPNPPSNPFTNQSRPGNNYAGCLHPIIGYGIRGVIWYQGESNTARASQYKDLMTLLIGEWRSDWKQGDFPFYFVQIADFLPEKPEPSESAWAELREAQTQTMKSVKNTGQAIAIDLGEGRDIHPRNKRDVAERLARWAFAKDYGFKDLVFNSPEYRSHEIANGEVTLSFDHTAGGLRCVDVDKLEGFAICGEDGKWVWADARWAPGAAPRRKIILKSTDVPNPVGIRYAWADNPRCNIISTEGLPLTPFRVEPPAKATVTK